MTDIICKVYSAPITYLLERFDRRALFNTGIVTEYDGRKTLRDNTYMEYLYVGDMNGILENDWEVMEIIALLPNGINNYINSYFLVPCCSELVAIPDNNTLSDFYRDVVCYSEKIDKEVCKKHSLSSLKHGFYIE